MATPVPTSDLIPPEPASGAASPTTTWELAGNVGTDPTLNFVGSQDPQPLVLRTNNVERARIDSSGNVGIGTNAPTYPLQIGAAGSGGFTFNASNQVIATTFGTGGNLTLGVTDAGDGKTTGSSIFLGGSTRADPLVNAITFSTAGSERVRITPSGDVGIRTSNPNGVLTLSGPQPAQGNLTFFNDAAAADIEYDGGNDQLFVIHAANSAKTAFIGGNVGIGVFAPTSALHVAGDVAVTGDVLLTGADCAEEFDAIGASTFEPGTVLVIDQLGALNECISAYDRRVAGVVSGGGDYKSGVVLDRRSSPRLRVPVALLGRVFCKVDADTAPVDVGDLLTTSSRPGYAMKASDSTKSFGAVIGKALRALHSGQKLIPILIALQ